MFSVTDRYGERKQFLQLFDTLAASIVECAHNGDNPVRFFGKFAPDEFAVYVVVHYQSDIHALEGIDFKLAFFAAEVHIAVGDVGEQKVVECHGAYSV